MGSRAIAQLTGERASRWQLWAAPRACERPVAGVRSSRDWELQSVTLGSSVIGQNVQSCTACSPRPGIRAERHSLAFRERFFAPLGLRDTVYEKHLAPGDHFADRLAHGYFTLPRLDARSRPARPRAT